MEVVVVDTCGLVVEGPVAEEWVGGEVPEPTLNPTAIPTPRAARTSATTPARTTVLRRTVISFGSSFATTICSRLREAPETTHGTCRRRALHNSGPHDSAGAPDPISVSEDEHALRRPRRICACIHSALPRQ